MSSADVAVLFDRTERNAGRIDKLSARLRRLELRLALYVGLGSFAGTGAQSVLSAFFGS